MDNESPYITVAIPTKNAGELFLEVLRMLAAQEITHALEILVIDSGSRDETVPRAKGAGCRVVEIPPQTFGHGRTRNLAMREAKGSLVAMLTQDAVPATKHWLRTLIEPFENQRVGCAFGRYVPRPDCDPIHARHIVDTFRQFGHDEEGTILQMPPPEFDPFTDISTIGFFSDVNACVRKSAWERVPYRDVRYAEDQLLGREMLAAGYLKAYCPKATVFHSHSLSLLRSFQRFHDEYRGLYETLHYLHPVNPLTLLPASLRAAARDVRYVARLPLSLAAKVKWAVRGFALELLRYLAAYLGPRSRRWPPPVRRALSYEHHIYGSPV